MIAAPFHRPRRRWDVWPLHPPSAGSVPISPVHPTPDWAYGVEERILPKCERCHQRLRHSIVVCCNCVLEKSRGDALPAIICNSYHQKVHPNGPFKGHPHLYKRYLYNTHFLTPVNLLLFFIKYIIFLVFNCFFLNESFI